MLKFRCLVLAFFLTLPSFLASDSANHSIVLDNDHIHTFRGRKGIWFHSSRDSLKNLARRYGTTVSEIQALNSKEYKSGELVFVPMGKEGI